MAARKIKDLAVATGEYTDRSGAKKKRYENIGSVFENDDGGHFMLLKRTFNLAGVPNPDNRDTVLVSSFDVRDADERGPASKPVSPERRKAALTPVEGDGGKEKSDIPSDALC